MKKRLLLTTLTRVILIFSLFGFQHFVSAQTGNITVKGSVKDFDGNALSGATVVEKGVTGNTVVADPNGNFSITVKEKSHLSNLVCWV